MITLTFQRLFFKNLYKFIISIYNKFISYVNARHDVVAVNIIAKR